MKIKNKKLLYALGSVAAISPLPLAGMILSQKDGNNSTKQQVFPYQFSKVGIDQGLSGVTCTLYNPTSEYSYFVGTTHGLYVSKDGVTFYHNNDLGKFVNVNQISAIISVPDGILVGTYQLGLWLSRNDGDDFIQLDNPLKDFLETSALAYVGHTLFVGTVNNGLWASTGQEALYTLRKQNFTIPGYGASINITSITMALIPSIFPGPIPVVGTYDHGLFAIQAPLTYAPFGQGLDRSWKINTVQDVNTASGTALFVGTEGHGLWSTKDGAGDFTQVGGNIGADFSISSISQTPHNNILVGAENHGLWEANNVDYTNFSQVAGGLADNWGITSIYDTSIGLYVGTATNGFWLSRNH